MAPRREPVESKTLHIVSQIRIKETGPEEDTPVFFTTAPKGRNPEKSYPTPPPCCKVKAPSSKALKIPLRESDSIFMTKQLNKVTLCLVPAPANIRPPGKN